MFERRVRRLRREQEYPAGAPEPAAPGEGGVEGAPDATPPPEALESLERGARVLGELGHSGIALRLDHDPHAGELRVSMTRNGSPVGRALSPRELLDLLGGGVEWAP